MKQEFFQNKEYVEGEKHGYYHEIISPSKNFPIMVYNHATGVEFCAKHWHRSIEVCCFINTPVELWENGISHSLAPDSLIIVNSGDVHELTPHKNNDPHGVSLIFPYDFLLSYGADVRQLRFSSQTEMPHDNLLRNSLHHISELLETAEEYAHLKITAEIYNVLYLLMAHYQCQTDEATYGSTYHMDRFREILFYIDANYAQNITLQTLSDHMNLSVGYLSRCFQRYLGSTFKSHLTIVRLKHARLQLQMGDKNMLQIALDSGFPDYRSFVSSFRKWYGITPYQYARQYRQKDQGIGKVLTRPEMVFAKHINDVDKVIHS